MSKSEIVLCAPVRTAIGTFNGSLKNVTAVDLGATAIRAAIACAGIAPERIDAVLMGNVVQAGNRMNPARQAAVHGGIPVEVPAMTLNRVCGSGAQAIASAAGEILAGESQVVLAGGMENMDQAPYLMPQARWGARMGDAQLLDSLLRDGLADAFSSEHSGWHTEDLAQEADISRQAQDRWAARSQQRFAAAQAAGLFRDEIVGVDIPDKRGVRTFDTDEANRPDTTEETLARLRPAFRPDGTITAGNSPGLNSGAAALIVAERGAAERLGLAPVARLVASGVAGVEPGLFGLGPVPAVRKALDRAGWTLADVDRYEINEAFAVVPLAVARHLSLPEDVINVEGGAVAHGHPIGATGAILAVRLLHAMRRGQARRGVVTLCIGGGQGIALALERI
ncbi:acetyl-CoA C-acetyltransferase [Pseudoduganella flava]|uniref:Acetyl-CoA C-acetyltransferase n=1 Tax=Pseudoduganella flava TaxID=871742 RepID=A0A562PKS9_9BURK|nr:thiolase family protein [Pseudoduganella flava]QGZ42362.1 acetyl-CoA C-acyltransferase [Pseudoduganella flava]TWI44923.1 acetyl-CoA C-acetyltransferase [Pseudoduganella flava]